MTTTGFTQREVSALAALTASVRQRAVPDKPWQEAGIAAEIRNHTNVPLAGVVWAFMRAACDPANDTPAALSQTSNRAWQTFDPWPCRLHPDRKGVRTNGECGGCYADRMASTTPGVIRDRGGHPVPDDAHSRIAEVLHRTRQRGDAEPSCVPSGTGWPREGAAT